MPSKNFHEKLNHNFNVEYDFNIEINNEKLKSKVIMEKKQTIS